MTLEIICSSVGSLEVSGVTNSPDLTYGYLGCCPFKLPFNRSLVSFIFFSPRTMDELDRPLIQNTGHLLVS